MTLSLLRAQYEYASCVHSPMCSVRCRTDPQAEVAKPDENRCLSALQRGLRLVHGRGVRREPLLILDETLRVRSANRAFHQTFHAASEETEERLIYELGNGQWDIPALRRTHEAT